MSSSTDAMTRPAPTEKALPRGYLRACLLLLLAESPAHGYDLLAQISELGFPEPDAGAVYRALRTLERQGLVESWWTPAVAGPARRPYRPTAAGARCLQEITVAVAQSHENLAAYLRRHRALTIPPDQAARGIRHVVAAAHYRRRMAARRIHGGALRRPTATARFGSSRRESHDASAFYERFVAPELSKETTVVRPKKLDVIYRHDARDMVAVESNSVALVVTSPPYFAGKEYEESLGRNGVPATYFEYLALLGEVFDECKRVLEPGGRIAVNVANLGRRPYRSLAGDVTQILQDLGLLLRGEVVWWKGRAAGGSCAWGTFQRPSNPVLRDVTERIVIASKGRFDRSLRPEERLDRGLPSTATISRDEFLEATTDLWEIPPESATRVGHPAPFPVELPKRLIELYTYEGDVVLDPFMGSGTTAVAALRTERHYIGFDTEGAYVDRADKRIAEEVARSGRQDPGSTVPFRVRLPAVPSADDSEDVQARAVRDGRQAKDLAAILLDGCGFTDIRSDAKLSDLGIEVSFLAADQAGRDWAFDVAGAFTSNRTGLKRTDTLWKALGRAAVLHAGRADLPLVLLTTDAPRRGSAGYAALNALMGPTRPIFDLVELLNVHDQERLREYAVRGRPDR